MGRGFRYPGLDNLGGVKMSKSNDAIWWSLFAAGGVVSALFIPVLILISGIVIPFTVAGKDAFLYERIHGAVTNPIIRILIFCLIVFPFFHFAHRFRSILIDIGLSKLRPAISVICYGSAIVGTLLTAVVLWNFS
jgi:fumarate reductase subunit D